MTDGCSATAKDQERYAAERQAEFELRRFALGERSPKQRARVVAAAQMLDAIAGNGYFTQSRTGYAAGMERRLKRFESDDQVAWIELILGWKPQNYDFFEIILGLNKIDPELYQTCCAWSEPEGYRAMRESAPLHPDAKVIEVNCKYLHSLQPDLRATFVEEAKKRDWRTHADRTGDVYALLLGPGEIVDLVWIAHYPLDRVNFTPDVHLGPERSRLANSKQHA